MNLKTRLKLAELAAAKRNGDLQCKVFIRHDDETDEQARTRLGIDSTTAIILISEDDANL